MCIRLTAPWSVDAVFQLDMFWGIFEMYLVVSRENRLNFPI